jgi:PQQ-dependent catabolism-associated CXXCW motif protein
MTHGRHTIALVCIALGSSAQVAHAQDSFGGAPAPQQQAYPQQQGDAQQQGYPPQQGQPQQQSYRQEQDQPQQQGYPRRGAVDLDQMMQMERQDFGVPPTNELHTGAMHGPTPNSIPGGQVITTKGLVALLNGRQAPALLLDILGGPEKIPGAQYAVPASQPGAFNDQTQQQFGQFLQQATGGNKEYPLVLYCLSPDCWMSYNASLRAINLGYTNVLWYRGGIQSWKQAGQPVQQAQPGYQ